MATERLLLIGCGKQAPKHIAGLRSAGLTDILLHDVRAEAAAKLGEQLDLPWVEDLDTAFGDAAIAAVDICTPTPTHYPLLKRALTAGKHAFCEKPPAETAAETRELTDLAQRQGCRAGVGFIYRFAPAFETLKELLDGQDGNPVLGKPVLANLQIGGRGSHAAWKHRQDKGGGAVNEMLVHMLDLAVWLFGSSCQATLLVKSLLRPVRMIDGHEVIANAEDYVVVRLAFTDMEGLIEADFVTPAFSQMVTVQAENGSFLGSIQDTLPSYVFLTEARGAYRQGRTKLTWNDANLFEKQMADFAATIHNPDHKVRCPISECVAVMEMLEAITSGSASD